LSVPASFSERFHRYINEVSRANTEPVKAFLLLEFIWSTFGRISADYADNLFPDLDRYVRYKGGTVAVKGRIDALLGNLMIELERDPGTKLMEAKDQLRKYTAILWSTEGRQRAGYMGMTADGVDFRVYRQRAHVPDYRSAERRCSTTTGSRREAKR